MINPIEVDRIHSIDLKSSDLGVLHVFHKEPILRAKCFISDPERYYTDDEARAIMYGERSWVEVNRSKEAARPPVGE